MNDITEFVIDRSKWRCGGSITYPNKINLNARGLGIIQLENQEGYMCCLGQITKQLRPDLSLLMVSSPDQFTDEISYLSEMIEGDDGEEPFNTPLAENAIEYNDDPDLTDDERENLLSKLFDDEGLKLTFVNEYVKPNL